MARSTWDFKEERRPCGKLGLEFSPEFRPWVRKPDISQVLVSRPEMHPWFLILWEPLGTHAPSPATAQPYCCYLRTIIFYYRPYMVDQFHRLWKCNGRWQVSRPGDNFLKYDQVEHSLTWDDEVVWDGETFRCGSGRVVWKNRRWWICHWARRKR